GAAWVSLAGTGAATVAQYGSASPASASVSVPSGGNQSSPVNYVSFTLPSAGVWLVDYSVRIRTTTIGQGGSSGKASVTAALYLTTGNALVAGSEVMSIAEIQTGTSAISSSFGAEATSSGRRIITTTGPT